MTSEFVICRDDLVRIVDTASAGITKRTRDKLLTVAETTDAVAAGWFHCDGVGCPIRQAGRITHQGFQQAYDFAMAEHLGIDLDYSDGPIVVAVASEGKDGGE